MSTSAGSSPSGWRQKRGVTLSRRSRGAAFGKAQISRYHRELRELENRIARLAQEMSAAIEVLEKHQSHIAAHNRRIDWLDRSVRGILNGRVWRTLELIGRLPRRLFKRNQSTT